MLPVMSRTLWPFEITARRFRLDVPDVRPCALANGQFFAASCRFRFTPDSGAAGFVSSASQVTSSGSATRWLSPAS